MGSSRNKEGQQIGMAGARLEEMEVMRNGAGLQECWLQDRFSLLTKSAGGGDGGTELCSGNSLLIVFSLI